MRVCVEGCAHSQLDVIYETIAWKEKQTGVPTDLLIICGDFQVYLIDSVTILKSCRCCGRVFEMRPI